MDLLGIIKERRSIRKFKKEAISAKAIDDILEAGRWAPSGLNNQPWKFMVLEADKKDVLCEYTHYGSIIKSADKVILVFLDKDVVYNNEKDLLAIGACIQNMLLYIYSIELGACWLGEILNKRDEINKMLKIPSNLQLEAAIALGKPAEKPSLGKRKQLKNLMV